MATDILVVHWEYVDGPHKGARFFASHNVENDGRIRDWPKMNMRPLGAVRVTINDGQGLELLPKS